MLLITVELLPDGAAWSRRSILTIGVANVSDLAEISSYVAVLVDDRGHRRDVLVTDHRREDGAAALISRLTATDFRAPRKAVHRSVADLIARRLLELSTDG